MTRKPPHLLAHGLALAVLATGLASGPAGPAAGAPADRPPTPLAGPVAGPVAGTVASTVAGTASGTIVFVKDHNVWIARGDGSGARALTTDGSYAAPYGSPTQSDGGVVVATHVERLVRMNQSGRVLTVLDPAPLPTSVGVAIDGAPVDAAISPDGASIAYTFTKYLTPSGASSGFRSATGYTAADRLTDPAPMRSTYFWAPSWVGNSRTLQTGGGGSHVNLHDLGAEPVHWFDDDDIYLPSTDLGNSQLSRDGRYLTAIRGYAADAELYWYAVAGEARSGPPPAVPEPLCKIPAVGIDNPTWGPDSDSLAWQEPDGIWTRANARDCDAQSALVIPGGSEPFWSPAALSAPEVVVTPPTTVLKNTAKPRITGRATVGAKLKASTGAWSVSGLTFRFTWLRNGKPIKGRSGRSQTHKVVAADRGKKLTVRVTATGSGLSQSVTSAAVKVKR